tara:strand:+ start:2983 stop:3510 length:528 start_codon:yes stop_codon:yes gene_type:complete
VRKLILILPLAITVAISTILLIFLLQKKDLTKPPSALLNESLPQLTLVNLLNKKELLSTDDLANKTVLINFFASWCAPCKVEHKFFFEIKKQKPNLFLLGINYKDENLDAINYLKNDGNPYDYVGIDDQGLAGLELGVFGLPETFIVNNSGKIIYKYLGPINKKIIQNEIYPLIK